MKKQMFSLLLVLCSYSALAQAVPEKLSGNIALHIAKVHYHHPVHFLDPYLNVWHMKGPLAEQVAMASLQESFANVNECAKDSQADVVLLLEPHVFYNPQLRVFHTEYIARAYTDDGMPITRVKKQASQLGSLGIEPDFFIAKGYQKAMRKIIRQLQSDQAFLTVLNEKKTIKTGTICHQLDQQPTDKFYY